MCAKTESWTPEAAPDLRGGLWTPDKPSAVTVLSGVEGSQLTPVGLVGCPSQAKGPSQFIPVESGGAPTPAEEMVAAVTSDGSWALPYSSRSGGGSQLIDLGRGRRTRFPRFKGPPQLSSWSRVEEGARKGLKVAVQKRTGVCLIPPILIPETDFHLMSALYYANQLQVLIPKVLH